jgi:AAA domain/Homeodomain-like domain
METAQMILAERIDFAVLMEPVALKLLGEPNAKLSNPPRDMRFGSRGSMAVDYEGGKWFDHENQSGGGVLDLIAHKTGRNRGEALAWLKTEGIYSSGPTGAGSPSPSKSISGFGSAVLRTLNVVGIYPYSDENGELLFEVVRYEPKNFRQRRAGTTAGTWIWNLDGVRRVPYRLPELISAVRDRRTILLCEGEKDADNARALGFAASTALGGANKWQDSYNEFFASADVVLLPHNDTAGRTHAEKVAGAIHAKVERVRVLDIAAVWPLCPEKGDISDWIAAGGTAEELQALIDLAPDWSPYPTRLRPLDLKKFLQLAIKPRGMVMEPIIPEKGLAMLYAARGTGKTHIALGIGFAVATGTKFLKWSAPKPRRVLLIDGEMPAAALQERLASIIAGSPGTDLNSENIMILAGDLIEAGGIGNLAAPEIQSELDPWLEGIEFLILDNLSSLTAVIRDNEAESWGPIQEWLLKLRRRGISVLIVHHAGKDGQQRGTSRREDVLDTSISLRRSADYCPTEGAKFEVHLEKTRGFSGDSAKPFEAKLEMRDGLATWTIRELDDANRSRIQALLDDGLTVREIADETGIPKSTVHRIKKAIEVTGGIDRVD